jgi:hypothetical protein
MMVDISSISSGFNSLKIAIDITRILRESGQSLEKAEIKLKLAELTEALAEAKIQFSEVQELVLVKDKQIKKLEEDLKIKNKLEWEPPVYYLINDNLKDGPFCPQCYDSEKKLIRLQGNNEGSWRCLTCKNSFAEERWKAKQEAAIRNRSGVNSKGWS